MNYTDSISKAQDKFSEMKVISSNIEDAEYLAQFDDTNTTLLPSIDTDGIVSLCKVYTDHNGKKRLFRYADLDHDGQYTIFHKNEDIPSCFENRDRLYHQDGPSEDGFFGVWSWVTSPNKNDASKDFVDAKYNSYLDVIEIVVITEASSLRDMARMLKGGINYELHSRRVIFCFSVSDRHYTGMLFKRRELNSVNGKIICCDNCYVVPIYEFSAGDVIRLDKELLFYSSAFIGIPDRLLYLKSPIAIVKDTVVDNTLWRPLKERGFTHAEHKSFRDFLAALPVEDIIGQIMDKCHCNDTEAKELLDEFIDEAWKYVDGDSIGDEIIQSAISASSELQEKTKELIRSDWEKENQLLLAEAKAKLDTLNMELENVSSALKNTKAALKKAESEEVRLANIITAKEKLAEDVEKAVSEKIKKAYDNAADFIANMAFVSGQTTKAMTSVIPAAKELLPVSDISKYHVIPAHENLEELEAHHCWADVIEAAVYELEAAGIAAQYVNGLSAFLCAAYIEKQPILLVGPNAIDIIQAFSAAVTRHKLGVLCCDGSYSNKIIAEIGTNGENIVMITNLITSGWINRLPEILSQKDIFYIAIHPYAEDIQVEPKSLYGFMLPLFTEFFVDKRASDEYFGGYFAKDFKTYFAPKGSHRDVRIFSKLTLSTLVRNRLTSLVNVMRNIYPTMSDDDVFLFAVFPIAYATMEMSELAGAIADSQKEITISASLKRSLQDVLGGI